MNTFFSRITGLQRSMSTFLKVQNSFKQQPLPFCSEKANSSLREKKSEKAFFQLCTLHSLARIMSFSLVLKSAQELTKVGSLAIPYFTTVYPNRASDNLMLANEQTSDTKQITFLEYKSSRSKHKASIQITISFSFLSKFLLIFSILVQVGFFPKTLVHGQTTTGSLDYFTVRKRDNSIFSYCCGGKKKPQNPTSPSHPQPLNCKTLSLWGRL